MLSNCVMGRVGSSIQHISAPVLTCANLSHVSPPLNVCQVIRNAFMKVHKDYNVPIKMIALLISLFLTAALQKERKNKCKLCHNFNLCQIPM